VRGGGGYNQGSFVYFAKACEVCGYMRKGMITSIGTVIQVSVMFRDKKKENKKMGAKHRTYHKTYK